MSKKLFLTKSESGRLMPHNEESEIIVKKWKTGRTYALNYKEARNPKHHRLIFGLANLAVKSSDENSYWNNKSSRAFIKAVQLTYDIGVKFSSDLNGEIHKQAESLSFENMDEDEFGLVSDAVFKEVARVLKIDEEYLRRNYEEIFRDARVFEECKV
jgi:hypothetical protein